VRAAFGGAPRGEHFGKHAAFAERAALGAGDGFQPWIGRIGLPDQLCLWIAPRIGFVQPGLVGEDHQRIRLHEIRYQRPKRVVVAELDLVGDYRVVLVDDGDHA
jgi:hypothetical protein